MKRLFVLVFAFLLPLPTFAAEQIAETTADKVLDRVDKTAAWASQIITLLAQKFGTTVEHVWPALIKLQLAYGIAYLIGAVSSLTIGLVAFFTMKKYAEQHDDVFFGFGVAILVIATIVFFPLMICGTIRVIAPEAMAIQYVIELFRPGCGR